MSAPNLSPTEALARAVGLHVLSQTANAALLPSFGHICRNSCAADIAHFLDGYQLRPIDPTTVAPLDEPVVLLRALVEALDAYGPIGAVDPAKWTARAYLAAEKNK